MAQSYNYDPDLLTVVDHARFHLGDTDMSEDGANAYVTDEAILKQLGLYGWGKGLANLGRGILRQVSQEPTKYNEGGGGVQYNLEDRLVELRNLIREAESGKIPDPAVTIVGGSPTEIATGIATSEVHF